MASHKVLRLAARLIELDALPLAGRFDAAHLKAIHKYIFQDVYSWAGEFRTVKISKGGHLGGLLGGAVLAWLLIEGPRRMQNREAPLIIAALLVPVFFVAAVGAAYAFASLPTG